MGEDRIGWDGMGWECRFRCSRDLAHLSYDKLELGVRCQGAGTSASRFHGLDRLLLEKLSNENQINWLCSQDNLINAMLLLPLCLPIELDKGTSLLVDQYVSTWYHARRHQ